MIYLLYRPVFEGVILDKFCNVLTGLCKYDENLFCVLPYLTKLF